MAFQAFIPLVLAFRCAAKDASAVLPSVGNALEADVALRIAKLCHGIAAVGVLGTVDAAAGEQACHLGDGDAVKLLMEDVIHPLLQVGDGVCQAIDQALGNLPQEDARFAHRVYKEVEFNTSALLHLYVGIKGVGRCRRVSE